MIFLLPSLEFGSNLGVSRAFIYVCELSDSIFYPNIRIWVMRELGNGEFWVRETVLLWYNFVDQSFRKAETTVLKYIYYAIPYVPSFISPLELASSHEVVGMNNDQRSKTAVEELIR
ncbi:hypothetical protein ACFE04_031097 [Oxalis oulophora]